MDLIKRYVYAVTRRLPEKQRGDVARELTSDIETMAAERNGGKRLAKAQVYDVLVELGDPEVFARQYQEGRRHLISPLYFETYITLLKSLFIIVLPLVAVFTVISDFFNTSKPGVVIVDALGAVVEVAIHIFFWVTIIVALIDRSGIEPEKKGAWKPEDLPAVPEDRRISKSDSISGIIWSAIAVVASLGQVPVVHDAVVPTVPLFFSDQMWPGWTLGILAISIVSLGVEILRLIRGRWDRITVWAITLINLAVVGYFAAILGMADRVVNSAFIVQFTKNAPDIDWQAVMANGVVIFAASVIIFAIYESGAAWYKLKKEVKG